MNGRRVCVGRKVKAGLSYYNVDTDRYQDIRIKKLLHNFSTAGLSVYDFILNEIYRDKGYFIKWDESTVFNVADVLKVKESTIQEVVNYCCSVGLFNKAVFTNENVLTSKSIQDRYLNVCLLCKRKPPVFVPEFMRFTPEDKPKTPEEMPFTPEESTQSKVKERKVNKKKEKIVPTEQEFLDYCQEFIKEPYHEYIFSLKAKYEQWVSDGWKDGNGNDIHNWKTKIKNTVPFLKKSPIGVTIVATKKMVY